MLEMQMICYSKQPSTECEAYAMDISGGELRYGDQEAMGRTLPGNFGQPNHHPLALLVELSCIIQEACK